MHPLHQLYGVTSRDGRKDCNNRDSSPHRMRGPIKARGEEILALISVRKCPLALSICFSGERQHTTHLFSHDCNASTPMGRPDKILLHHPSTPVFLVLSGRCLDWQKQRVAPFNSISLSQEVTSIMGSCTTDCASHRAFTHSFEPDQVFTPTTF